jgi:hypothetical protein
MTEKSTWEHNEELEKLYPWNWWLKNKTGYTRSYKNMAKITALQPKINQDWTREHTENDNRRIGGKLVSATLVQVWEFHMGNRTRLSGNKQKSTRAEPYFAHIEPDRQTKNRRG